MGVSPISISLNPLTGGRMPPFHVSAKRLEIDDIVNREHIGWL